MADESMVSERVEELTWALVDEEISNDEISLLDSLLLSDDQARKRYMDCVQLHADLTMHYAKPQPVASGSGASKSPVLGFLNAGFPPAGYDLPPVGDAQS